MTAEINSAVSTETASQARATTKITKSWLKLWRHYLAFVGLASLVWEFTHMPLDLLP